MGRLPAEVRTMTPAETALLITGWNEAQGDGMPDAPSMAELEDLKRQFPDG